MAEGNTAFWTAVGAVCAALAAPAGGAIGFFWKSMSRKDKLAEARQAHDDKRLEMASAELREMLERQDKDNARLRTELDAAWAETARIRTEERAVAIQARRDSDRGWWLARNWERKAHAMRHRAADLWMMLVSAYDRAARGEPLPPLPPEPDLTLPALEEPTPESVRQLPPDRSSI